MNLGRYSTSALAVSFASLLGAQSITLVAPGNIPNPGTEYQVHRGTYHAPLPAGADQLFDFSTAVDSAQATYHWNDPAQLPNGAAFPEAQFALTGGGPDTIFYKATANGIERIGDTKSIVAGIYNFHFTTAYTNSVLELKLPSTFGDAMWMDLFAGNFTVDGTTYARNGSMTGGADAWGRIILPGGAGTVEVLRVQTRVQEEIAMNVGIPITVQHIRNESAYWPLWGKLPVLRTVNDTLASPFITQKSAYTEWLDAASVGVADLAPAPMAAQVFPNPASDRAQLVFSSATAKPVQVQVINAQGAVVLRMETGKRVVDLEVRNWEAGNYRVVLTTDGGQRTAVPLVVVH